MTQKEFYRLFALYNQVPERGRAVKVGNSPPFLMTPTHEQQQHLDALAAKLAAAEQRVAEQQPQLSATIAAWETSTPTAGPEDWSLSHDLAAHIACDVEKAIAKYPPAGAAKDDKPEAAVIRGVDGDIAFRTGPVGSAVSLSGQNFVDCGDVADFGYFDKFTIACWVMRGGNTDGVIWSRIEGRARRRKALTCKSSTGVCS